MSTTSSCLVSNSIYLCSFTQNYNKCKCLSFELITLSLQILTRVLQAFISIWFSRSQFLSSFFSTHSYDRKKAFINFLKELNIVANSHYQFGLLYHNNVD